jgi:folate-binding protein YgfZ
VSNVVARVGRDLVVVSGPDATSFLQSLLSQDLDPVPVGGVTHALLLQPQGKLVVDMRALHVAADEWWCVCEAGFGAQLAQGLLRFKIRVKVEIEDRSEGSAALATLTSSGAVEIDSAGYEAQRVEAGVPRQGFDIDETTIAQEAYLERDAVSFTKGCFLGQELVCRIDSRGHVNRLLRRLRADAPLARGAPVFAGEKEVGTVTTDAGSNALAMLRRTVEPASEVVVRTAAGDVTARVEAVLPD